MDNRQKLLESAGRAYAELGFRGATTRRIAEDAGVNEVTLFRLFGSKARLMIEAIKFMEPATSFTLPAQPVHPQDELTTWCEGHAKALRRGRAVIRKTMADLDEHPELGPFVCDGKLVPFRTLTAYAHAIAPPDSTEDEQHLLAACSMLMSAIFADAMGRDVVPETYPAPEDEAPARYVRVFLRALGVVEAGSADATPSSRALRTSSEAPQAKSA